MKILMVSSFLPYPLFSGGHIRLYNLIKELSKRHSITLICEKRNYQTQDDINEFKKLCKDIIAIERRKQWTFGNILNSGLSTYPFLLTGHTNSLMKKHIQELLEKEKFDLIHVETFYVMQNMPKITIPIVLIEHNIEYLVYQRFAKTLPLCIRPVIYFDAWKMKYWEEQFWQKATRLVVVSEAEKKFIKREDVAVVPNGVDIEKFKVHPFGKLGTKFKVQGNERRILFIGDFKWLQNRDAVEWILKEIWPEISAKCNPSASLRARVQSAKFDMKLWIVGREIPDSIKKLTNDENVIFDENAPNETSEIFRQADLLLAPIRVGGGTSFKILEAMASGVPVVTTHLGIEGIEAENGREALIADNTEGLVKQVLDVLQSRKTYEKLIGNARRLIEGKYDWKIIVKDLEKVYKSATI